MRRRVLAGIALLFLACVLTSPQVTGDDEKSAGPFGLARVWAVHLDIPAAEYQAMQPAGGMGFFGPPPKAPPAKRDDGRPREKNLFGLEFPWAHGDLTADGVARRKVGLRYAGDGTYFAASRGLRRPLRVELSRFADQNLHGLTALNLHAGALDPTRAREALAFAVFRAAGVPAPRTAFAEVTLTVPGRYTREYLGLYTVVEDVDQAFLRDRFKTDKGLLLRPERMQGLAYLGEEWEKYKGQYQPRSEATKEQAGRVIAFARLIQQADDKQFRAEVGSYLDIDAFLRFLAANALVANTESFFALGHNYYLYLHPTTNRFHFLPKDLELSLANFLLMGSTDQLMDMSLTQPYPGPNRLADRLLADKAVREKYREILKELASTCFTKERLLKDLDAVEKAVKEPLAREAKATAARKEAAGGFGPPPPPLRRFVERRTASVAAQLAGRSKGYVPRFAFGPPAAAAEPVTETTVRDILQPPPEFDVTLFAAPPQVNYPVTVAAAPTGEVFVAVDEQGSLGRTPGGG
jgi:spore coat protein CotH